MTEWRHSACVASVEERPPPFPRTRLAARGRPTRNGRGHREPRLRRDNGRLASLEKGLRRERVNVCDAHCTPALAVEGPSRKAYHVRRRLEWSKRHRPA